MENLLGRVRVVYFSRGEDGVRWERMGLVPDKSPPEWVKRWSGLIPDDRR
jgi:hypothetical protein